MNTTILDTIDRALAAINIDPANLDVTRARIRVAMIELAQAVGTMYAEKQHDPIERLRKIELVIQQFVGCPVDKLTLRHIDMLRTAPVDIDKLMTAFGGEWEQKVKTITADEAERKKNAAAYVAGAAAPPIMGYRDKNGKKITKEEAAQLAKETGASVE